MPKTHKELFDRIQQHPLICQNCYRFTHDEEIVPLVYRERQSAIQETQRISEPDRTTLESLPGDCVASWRPKRVCECGIESNFVKHRPVDKQELLELAENLSDALETLQEQHTVLFEAQESGTDIADDLRLSVEVLNPAEFEHSRSVLRYTVERLKSHPELQFRDEDILLRGVKLARLHPDMELFK